MKHRSQGRKFGRVRSQRKALMKTLLGSLVEHDRIVTTEAKAKELKSQVDRIVVLAKLLSDDSKKLATSRLLAKRIPTKAITKLAQDDVQKRFAKRESGFTRVVKLAPRKSDSARMAVIEFVD